MRAVFSYNGKTQMEHLQTIRKKAEIPPFLYFLYFVSASALLMSGGVLRFPVTVFSLLGNSVYFCTVPLAVFSLLGIQCPLLYRSACSLFTARHTASASVPFRCCLRRHAASTARPSLRAKKKGPCGKAGIENRIKGRNRNGSEELRRSSSSPRSISIAQLSTLLRLHLRPIKLVVSK